MKIEIESEGIFCPQCGSRMQPFGRKSLNQYRCVENPEHYATDETIKTKRTVIFDD